MFELGDRAAKATDLLSSLTPSKAHAGFENNCTELLHRLGHAAVAATAAHADGDGSGVANMTLRQADIVSAYATCGFSKPTISLVLRQADVAGQAAADILTAVDESGDTALHYAARHGHAASVTMLLDAGADPGIRNVFGMTAADIARRYGWEGMDVFLQLTGSTATGTGSVEASCVDKELKDSDGGTMLLLDSGRAGRDGGDWVPPMGKQDDDTASEAEAVLPYPSELVADIDTGGCTSVETLDWPTFRREFRSLSRPVLVRRPAVDDGGWKVWSRWRRDALRAHYGSIPVHTVREPQQLPTNVRSVFSWIEVKSEAISSLLFCSAG
jgi:hypothetical protein